MLPPRISRILGPGYLDRSVVQDVDVSDVLFPFSFVGDPEPGGWILVITLKEAQKIDTIFFPVEIFFEERCYWRDIMP